MVSGLRDKVLLRRTYARLFPAEFANKPKKQFNAPFVKSNELMERFNTREVFEATGVAGNTEIQRDTQFENGYLEKGGPVTSSTSG